MDTKEFVARVQENIKNFENRVSNEEESKKNKEYQRAYREKNKEKLAEQQKKWRDKNRERIKELQAKRVLTPEQRRRKNEKQKEWRRKNKEKLKVYRSRDKEKQKERQRDWYIKWADENYPEVTKNMSMSEKAKWARRIYQRRYYESNKERINAQMREWRKNNPDKVKTQKERYFEKLAERYFNEMVAEGVFDDSYESLDEYLKNN